MVNACAPKLGVAGDCLDVQRMFVAPVECKVVSSRQIPAEAEVSGAEHATVTRRGGGPKMKDFGVFASLFSRTEGCSDVK